MLIQKYSIDEHEISFSSFFFKFNSFFLKNLTEEIQLTLIMKLSFTYAVQSVLPRPYREYKIKYMYLYITAKATLNTGNDYSILLYVVRMLTVEDQLRIV